MELKTLEISFVAQSDVTDNIFDDFSKIVKNYSVKGDFKEYNINSKPKIVEKYYAFDDSNNIEVKHQYLLSEIINHCSNILYDHFYQKYCSK